MNKIVSTFEAKCLGCGKRFAQPSFGEFGYGEAILFTQSGKHRAWVSAFSAVPQRLNNVLPSTQSSNFWHIVASLADPVEGEALASKIICPYCTSDKMAYWGGRKIGTAPIPEATFLKATELNDAELTLRSGLITTPGEGSLEQILGRKMNQLESQAKRNASYVAVAKTCNVMRQSYARRYR